MVFLTANILNYFIQIYNFLIAAAQHQVQTQSRRRCHELFLKEWVEKWTPIKNMKQHLALHKWVAATQAPQTWQKQSRQVVPAARGKFSCQPWALVQGVRRKCSRHSSAPGTSSAAGSRKDLSWQHPLITHRAKCLFQKRGQQNRGDHYPPLPSTELEVPLFGSTQRSYNSMIRSFGSSCPSRRYSTDTEPSKQSQGHTEGPRPGSECGKRGGGKKKSLRMYHWKHCFN